MNLQFGVLVTDASSEEKDFFKATVSVLHPSAIIYTADAYGRGPERAAAYALEKMGETLKKAFPESRRHEA